jgi:hypothetical protein
MTLCHSIYGLRLAAESPVPSLPFCKNVQKADVQVHLKRRSASQLSIFSLPCAPLYQSSNLNDSGQPIARVGILGSRYFGFFYSDGARFAVRLDGREIWADGPENYAVEDLATYLVGPVMGFVLRLFGTLPLHGCGVAVEGKAIALVGPQGAGKSTTAAAFAKLGFGILSEDVVALVEDGDCFVVQPGYPRVNLWPESAEKIFGDAHGLPPVTPTWGKHFLALDDAQYRFQDEPLELGAIFVLQDRLPGAHEPRAERISPASAMPILIKNTYVNYLLDSALRQTEFLQLGRLLRQTPVYDVSPCDDPNRVFDLCKSIAVEARRSAARPILS